MKGRTPLFGEGQEPQVTSQIQDQATARCLSHQSWQLAQQQQITFLHASLLHLSQQPHRYAVETPRCNSTPQASEDRLDSGRCLLSALHWLPSNEVLHASWGLQNLQYAFRPGWGSVDAFSVVFSSHPFPCDKLSQTPLNYSMMC